MENEEDKEQPRTSKLELWREKKKQLSGKDKEG